MVSVIENQTMEYIEDNNILGDNQGAFRRGRRCEDHIYSLKGICGLRKQRKLNTYLGFLDISKAFDTLDRDNLFIHIWEHGIQGKAWRLIHMLYRQVDNKVIFGDFESDFYEVNAGVKQGCIMSPCLFNLVMTDLEQTLQCAQGVQVGERTVHGLFYADDIVLMANSEQDLLLMLSKSDSFAKKWGLSFNDRKSQVMIIGKRISNKLWPMGNMSLSETNTYKYLGVIITSTLKDNVHITSHLADKAKKMQSHLRYTLAHHMDIKRVQFGCTLWEKALLPSLSHAAGIWFNETETARKKLASFQYQCARGVLKLHCMPSSVATIAELGWLPIIDYLDIKRVAYFQHVYQMQDHRLTKLVFNELSKTDFQSSHFNYFTAMRHIFERQGLDHMFHHKEHMSSSTFKTFVHNNYKSTFLQDISKLRSLHMFKAVKLDTLCSRYLTSDNCNFKGQQLKFKLRTGTLGLGEDLYRQNRGMGMCFNCNTFETARHFIMHCPCYHQPRQTLMSNLKNSIDPGVFNIMLNDANFAVYSMLGSHGDIINSHFCDFIEKAWQIRRNLTEN